MSRLHALNQKGAIPVLILIAAIGVISFLAFSFFTPFKNTLFSALFPKDPSKAAGTVPTYSVYEDTITYTTGNLSNKWEDVSVKATFITPSNKTINIDGFYYGINTYKVRFAPVEIGNYSYTINITGPNGNQTKNGAFTSVASNNKGFLKRLPASPFKLVYEDGSVFFGVGFSECWGRSDPPSGHPIHAIIGDPTYEPAGEGGVVDLDMYWQSYQKAGFSWFRTGNSNCGPEILRTNITTTGNTYNDGEAKLLDQIIASAKNHGFHVMYNIFSYNIAYPNAAEGTPESDAVKRAIDYTVARYGAYVDFWEIANEKNTTEVPDAWLDFSTKHIRSIDPYGRLITNTNPRATDPLYLDTESEHPYGENGDFFNRNDKVNGLPLVFGEIGRKFGNGLPPPPYNPSEVAKMRLTSWTGFLGGMGMIYWNTSFKTTCCNQYIGATERSQNEVLADFVSSFDANFTSAQLPPASTCAKAYSFTSNNVAGAYVFCEPSIKGTPTTQTASFSLNVPFAGIASWVDPATGNIIQSFPVNSGNQNFTTPSYTEDLALKIRNSSAPSTTPTPTPISDSQPPQVPTGLKIDSVVVESNPSFRRVYLSWNSSSDNVGVYAYRVYRDSVNYGATALTKFYDNSSLTPGVHTYYLTAVDAAGNESTPTQTITIDTTNPSTGSPPPSPTPTPTPPLSPTPLPSGTNTIKIFSSPSDGRIGYFGSLNSGCTQATWGNAYSQTSASVADTNASQANFVNSGCFGNNAVSLGRGFLYFDTSSIPQNATITSANLGLFVTTKKNDANDGSDYLSVVHGLQSSDTSLSPTDFVKAGDTLTNPTELSNRLDLTNIITNAFAVFNLNPQGTSQIAAGAGAVTKFAIREGHDMQNLWTNSANQSGNKIDVALSETTGTTQDPYLEITYTTLSPSPIPGDIDGSRKVDIFDYNALISNFGRSGTGLTGDLNSSGKVDIFDYNILITNFGRSG